MKKIVIRNSPHGEHIEIFLVDYGRQEVETLVAKINKDFFEDRTSYDFYKSFTGEWFRNENKKA